MEGTDRHTVPFIKKRGPFIDRSIVLRFLVCDFGDATATAPCVLLSSHFPERERERERDRWTGAVQLVIFAVVSQSFLAAPSRSSFLLSVPRARRAGAMRMMMRMIQWKPRSRSVLPLIFYRSSLLLGLTLLARSLPRHCQGRSGPSLPPLLLPCPTGRPTQSPIFHPYLTRP